MFGGDGSTFVDLHAATATAGFDPAGGFTVPAEFLFHGEYKRVGNDLKIIGEHGKAFVVHDYFKTGHLHTLFAPDGAALTGDIVAALAGPLAPGRYAQATPPQGAAQAIGRVATEQGSAIAVRNGVTVALNVGDVVLKGDVIQTQGGSAVGIIFSDGTTFNLGANARMVLNEFVYDPSPGSANSALINLVQGSITFVAGQVAHTGDMKVGTPSATMGIRGTAVQVDIDVNNGTTKLSVLVEPGGRVGEFLVYSLTGQLIATVDNANNQTTVTPAGTATSIAKTPAEIAQALTLVQQVFQTQAVGQAILAAQPLPGNNANQNNQTPDQTNQPRDPNSQPLQKQNSTTPQTQITSTDVSSSHVVVNVADTPNGPIVSVPQPPSNPEPTPLVLPSPPPPPPPPPPPTQPAGLGVTATTPTPLIEAAGGQPGNSASVVVLTVTGGSTATFDAGKLLADNWHDAGNGVYTKDGVYGTALLSTSAGTLSYTLDNSRAVTDKLVAGEIEHDVFTIPVTDGTVTANGSVSFEIDGRNDPPVIATAADLSFETGLSAWRTAGQVTQVLGGADGTHAAQLETAGVTAVSAEAIEAFLGLAAGTLAALNSGGGNSTTPTEGSALAKDFALHAGQILTFDWDFSTTDYSPFKDFAFYSVSNGAIKLSDVFMVGDFGDSGWHTVTFTAPSDGTYLFGFGVLDAGDTSYASDLLIDNVRVGGQAASASVSYVENQAPTTIGQSIVVGDVDSITLVGATVAISGGFHSGQDVLGFVDQNGIHGTYNASSGVLTLTGTASLADYQAALQSVAYSNSSDNPSADTRTISFQVNDGSAENNLSNVGLATVAVTPVNDAPTLMSPAVAEVTQNAGVQMFTAGSLLLALNAHDAEGDPLKIVNLQLLGPDGNPVNLSNPGVSVSLAGDGSLISFSVDAGNFKSLDAGQHVTLTANFNVTDSHGGVTPASAQLIVDGVNDAPVTTNAAVTTNEDTPYVFQLSDFPFADPNDSPANSLASVVITSLTQPPGSTLTLNGSAVALNTPIAGSEIVAGHLVFTEAANGSGSNYASFAYAVVDNGGTANGGQNTSSAATMAINVTPVNDAPGGSDNAVATTVNQAYTFQAADFGFSDPNDTPANTLLAVEITTLPGAGTLSDNGAAVGAGQFVSAADINAGQLAFTPATNASGSTSFTFQVQDNGGTGNGGVNLDPTPNTIAVNVGVVTPINSAPSGADNGVTTNEDQAYTFHAADFGFSDPNDTPPNSLLAVEITTLPASGTLTDNGTAVSAGQLVSVVDINAGQLVFTPAANASGSTSFTFQVQDNGGTANGGVNLDPTPNTITVNVTPVNDAPVANANGGGLAYTENQGAAPIDTALTLSDVDSANLAGATVSITANFAAGQDVLGFTNQNGITGSYNSASGVLTLSGSSSLANYQAALRSVTYFDSSDNPSGLARTIGFQVNDGAAANNLSNVVAANVTVTPVNDAPVIQNVSGTVSTNQNTQTLLAAPTGLVTDADAAPGDLLLATLSVAHGTLVPIETTGLTIVNGQDGSGGILSFTGTQAAIAQAVQSGVTYTPGLNYNGPDTLTFTVNDQGHNGGGGAQTATATVGIVVSSDQAPALGNVAANAAYTELAAPVTLSSGLTVGDIDNATLASATVSITGGTFVAGDTLAAATAGTAITAAYNAGVLTLSGSDTLAHYQAVLDSVTFSSSSHNPTNSGANTSRSISWVANDGTLNSSTQTTTLAVTPVNDAPAVNANGGGLAYTENQAATPIDTALTLSDVDSANLAGATVSITGNFAAGQDVLGFTNQNGITGSYNSASGVLTLSGSSSLANYQAALRSVTYFDSSDNPSALARTISFQVNDGAAANNLSNVATAGVTVTPVNDAPVIDLTPIITEVPIPNPLPAGTDAAAQQEVAPVISQFGRFVAFFSSEVNPDTNNGNDNSPGDVFLYDRQTGVTTVLTDAAHVGSLSPGETFGDGLVSISGDGATVVFRGQQQVADPQSPTGFDNINQIYVYDRVSDTVRVLTNPDNGNTPYTIDDNAIISDAGNRIVFDSFVSSGNGPPTGHLYVTDLAGHIQTDLVTTQFVPQPSDPSQSVSFSQPDISGAGRYLTFWVETRSFDSGTGTDTPIGSETLYTYDRATSTTKMVASTTASNNDWPASMSDDGRYIVFQSDSDALDVQAGGTANGKLDIFVYDRNANGGAGGIIGVTDSATMQANGDSERASISGNGRYVIFASTATNLVAGDTNGQGDTFVYDLQTQAFQRISVAMDGSQGNGDSTLGADAAFGANGTVFGSTASNLVVPNDSDNGNSDIFAVDRSAGTLSSVVEDVTTPGFAGAPVGSLSTHNAFHFTDVDLADTHTVSVTGVSIDTSNAPAGFNWPAALGTFTPTIVETPGSGSGEVDWTFTIDNALVQGLSAFQNVQQIYTVQISDGHGGNVSQAVTVSIFGVDDAPVLGSVAASAAYTAQGAGVTLAPSLTVNDIDTATMVSATMSITGGFFAGDTLAATTAGTAITANYNAATGVLFLSGNDTLAHYQSVLDSVSFSSSNSDPTNAGADPSRTISWVVNDGILSSNPQTTALSIASGNVSPTISGDKAISVGQGDSVVLTAADLHGIDPDNTANQLIFSVTAATAGWVALSSAPGTHLTSFSEAQLEAGSVVFIQDGSPTTSSSFSVSLSDGVAGSTPANATVNAAVGLAQRNLWGDTQYPAVTPGLHLFGVNPQVNATFGFVELAIASSPDYVAGAPSYDTIRSFATLDPFFLPEQVVTASPLFAVNAPAKNFLIVPNVSISGQPTPEGIYVYKAQDTVSGANEIFRVIGLENASGGLDFTPVAPIDESFTQFTNFDLYETFRNSAGVAQNTIVEWDQYNPAGAGSYRVYFQPFDLTSNAATGGTAGAIVTTPINLSSVAIDPGNGQPVLPAWFMGPASGGYVLAYASPSTASGTAQLTSFGLTGQTFDSIQFQTYTAAGATNNSSNFTVIPDVSAHPGATNHITQNVIPSLNPYPGQGVQQLQFQQLSTNNNIFGVGWNETVTYTDGQGSHTFDQVEFDAIRPGTGLIYHEVIQVPDGEIQNIRVKNFTDPSVAGADDFVIAYGDDSSTNIREYRVATSGGTTTVTPVEFSPGVFVLTDPTTVVFDNITATGDGRIVVNYDRLVNGLPDQTSQYEFKTFDLRTTAISIDGNAPASGHDRYVAGTQFSDTFLGENNVDNTYYYIGANLPSSGPTPQDVFHGGTGGWNTAIFADDYINYSISGFVITNIGDPAHNGSLTIDGNVQALAFNPTNDPSPASDGSMEATGDRLVILSSFSHNAIIDTGATLEFHAAASGVVAFDGATGTLVLDQPSSFAGQIAGIAGSGNVLDLVGFDNAANVSYSGTSSSGTLTVSEGATTVHLNVAGTNMGAFVSAGLDSSGTGLLIHDPAADPAEQHHVADGTLDGAAASDTIGVTSLGNYPGVLTVSPNGNGGFDWHFAASDNDIAQQAGQTQNYMVQDLTAPSASQALSVSIGGSGQDQFQFSSGSGAHALVDFSTSSDASGHYAGDTVNLVNFSNDHGGSLTLNDILAELTTDSHGNAVVNLGHGDSIVFEHISASVILSQVDQGHPVFTLGVNQA